jgi:hypothetical protein
MEGVNKTGQDEGEVGDVETAGETTAAAAISGPDNPKPVGADTMVKVSDPPERAEDDRGNPQPIETE